MHAEEVQHPPLTGHVTKSNHIYKISCSRAHVQTQALHFVSSKSFLYSSNHISRNNFHAYLLKFNGLKNFKAYEDRNDVDYINMPVDTNTSYGIRYIYDTKITFVYTYIIYIYI